jgi:hypothetical protein
LATGRKTSKASVVSGHYSVELPYFEVADAVISLGQRILSEALIQIKVLPVPPR